MSAEQVKVVVLGIGLAGSSCAAALSALPNNLNLDITLIDTRQASVLKYAGCRSAVLGDKYAYRATIPNLNLISQNKGRIIHCRVRSIDENLNCLILEDNRLIKYDYLICASGARNVSPCEPPLECVTLQQQVQYYQDISTMIKNSANIMVLGSGAVGTELAGEIKCTYPEKEVAILSPGRTLVDGCQPAPPEKFFKRLSAIASKIGLKLHLNQRAASLKLEDFGGNSFLIGKRMVKTTTNETIPVDLILLCTGKKLNNEVYPKSWLNEIGMVKVQPTLQVEGKENIFAIGDISNVQENKQGYFAQKHGRVAAENIRLLIKGKKLKSYKPSSSTQIIVPLGRRYGVSYLGGFTLGNAFTSNLKGKDLFVSEHWALYRQKKLLLKENDPDWKVKIDTLYPTLQQAKSSDADALFADTQMDERELTMSYKNVMDKAEKGEDLRPLSTAMMGNKKGRLDDDEDDEDGDTRMPGGGMNMPRAMPMMSPNGMPMMGMPPGMPMMSPNGVPKMGMPPGMPMMGMQPGMPMTGMGVPVDTTAIPTGANGEKRRKKKGKLSANMGDASQISNMNLNSKLESGPMSLPPMPRSPESIDDVGQQVKKKKKKKKATNAVEADV